MLKIYNTLRVSTRATRQFIAMAHNTPSTIFNGNHSIDNDSKLNHLFEESSALNVYDTSMINLAAGCPGTDLMAPLTDVFKKATDHRMSFEKDNNCYLFQYGNTVGLWGLRNELAKFLTRKYGDTVQRQSLVLTCGASHGLHLLLSTMLVPDGIVFVEEFTYMIALDLIREFPNYQVVPIPMNSDGVDIEKLQHIVREAKSRKKWAVDDHKPFWAVFYIIPTYHNPMGIVYSEEKCKAIVRVAREYDMLVISEDVYNLLHYDDTLPPKRLFKHDVEMEDYKGGHVVSNCTLSKLLAPGVRVGWIEVPKRIWTRLRQSGILQSGGSVNNVMFGIIQSALELNLIDGHVEKETKILKDRMNTMCRTLTDNMPDGCSFETPRGGYFVWLRIPTNAKKFLAWSVENGGPGAVSSDRFQWNPRDDYQAIRLSIAFHDAKTIEEAVTELMKKLTKYLKL